MRTSDTSRLSYNTRLFLDEAVYNLYQEEQNLNDEEISRRILTDWMMWIGKQVEDDGKELIEAGEKVGNLTPESRNAFEGALKAVADDIHYMDEIEAEALEMWDALKEETKENASK